MHIIERDCAVCGERFIRTETRGHISDMFCGECLASTSDELLERNRIAVEAGRPVAPVDASRLDIPSD